ncbi:MAG: tetratricopeptide repeat protein [Bacteroidales bacterium]|nr:tetratricopeptide repeat protein [Bacteroidales bacterium]MBN2819140.1 tetratricopeptide repeat protein [Bacteroidales bacterium]
MKNLKLNLLLIAVSALVLSNCGGLQKMVDNAESVSYKVQPTPLETHGGEVEITVDASFPEKFFNKKAIVTATPVLKYEGGQTEFESITLQGESVEANNKVIPYAGGSYSLSAKIPYEDAMLKSMLVMQMTAQIGDKAAVEIPGVPIATGVIATPTLVMVKPEAIAMSDNFKRIIPETYSSDIHYVINKYDVRSSELKSDDIVDFNNKVKAASENERVEIKAAKISAYASPDGEIDLNTKLSDNRGKSAESYLSKTLKKLNVQGSDAEQFLQVVSTAEDWDGFKKLMEESTIKDKELILRVLSMYSDADVREKEIKNIAEAYLEIKDDVLPKLRRSQLLIDVDKVGYSDEELSALASENPDTLNVEELLYAATLTDDNETKLAIYQKTFEKYPECVRAINNVGYVYVKLGKTAEAKAAFEKAKAIKENDIVKNNLGVVALLEGDAAAAEALFTSAMSAGESVNYNLGIIKIQQGDYAAAVNYFGNKPSFNAALAQLCNGETEKCITTLTELGEVDCSWVYYLKAVAGARAGREEVVLSNIRLAVEKDKEGEIKAYALKDAEFRNFIASEGFAAIVQ